MAKSALDQLPRDYHADRWVQSLCRAFDAVQAQLADDAARYAAQVIPSKMTLALPIEEGCAGMAPAAGATDAERRAALSARWQSAADKCSLDSITQIFERFSGIHVAVQFDGRKIALAARTDDVSAVALQLAHAALRDCVPAHIPFSATIVAVQHFTLPTCVACVASVGLRHRCGEISMIRPRLEIPFSVGGNGTFAAHHPCGEISI